MGRPPTVYFLQFQYSRAGTISTSCNVLSPEQGIKEANIRFIFFLQVAKSGYSRDRFIQNPPHGGHPCLWLTIYRTCPAHVKKRAPLRGALFFPVVILSVSEPLDYSASTDDQDDDRDD